MADNKSKLTIEDYKRDFKFKKKENELNIQFNRVAFIFLCFFYYLFDLRNTLSSLRFTKE